MNQIQTLLLSFLMNVLSHSPNVIFPSEVLSYDMQYGFFLKKQKVTY